MSAPRQPRTATAPPSGTASPPSPPTGSARRSSPPVGGVARRVAERSGGAFALDWTELDWGSDHYARTGLMMPRTDLETLRGLRRDLLRRRRWPTVPDTSALGPAAQGCQGFDQWANVRPVTFYPGVTSPLRKADDTELDWVVVRENSRRVRRGSAARTSAHGRAPARSPCSRRCFTRPDASGSSASPSTWPAPGRARRSRASPSPTPSSTGWCCGTRCSRPWPPTTGRRDESVLVDALSAKFVLSTEDLSVVVASNLQADILSDLGQRAGREPGARLQRQPQPRGPLPQMFEPVHGSAPDIAARASPTRRRHRERRAHARAPRPAEAAWTLHAAVERTLADGVMTRDVGGTASTDEVVEAIVARLGG